MGDGASVALNLPNEHAAILRRDLADWAADLRNDLREPERLADANRSRAEAEAYERLCAAVEIGELRVPDAEALRVLRAAAEAHDRESEYERVVAEHDAMHGLLAALEGGRS
ncbi:MAG TPA: hypothetical protein VFT19_10740 [Solirubrobacterales bacterium]|nr:hypothetical protein [Solirubrobacterales bacterium]